MAQTASKPPTTQDGSIYEGGLLPGWGGFQDEGERNDNWMWPQSVETASSMLNDSQVEALRRAVRLPQFRRRWMIDPNEARPELVQYTAAAYGLPVQGDDTTRPRMIAGFSWRRHLVDALRGLDFGHHYDQIVLDKDNPDSAGRLPLRKLAPIPQRTIRAIDVEQDGGLRAIWVPTPQGVKQDGPNGTRLGVERLLAYVWDQSPGNWAGRSMLRSIYREYLAKDQLIKTDVTKHMRNGMGVPTAEQTDRSATPKDLADAQAVASRWRTGDTAAAGTPFGTRIVLKGVEGNLPDTLASIRYQDEAMARSFLAMFLQLGQTDHGSRALGESFVDFFALAEDAVSEWVCDATNLYSTVKLAAWAFGVDPLREPVPLVVSGRDETAPVDANELAALVREGLLVVDDELHAAIRESLKLPAAGDPIAHSYQYDLDYSVLLIDERRAQIGLGPLPNGEGDRLPVPSNVRFADQPAGQQQRALAAVNERREHRGLHPLHARHFEPAAAASATGPSLPSRPLRREPLDFEIAAAIDLNAIDTVYEDNVQALVDEWVDVRAGQVDELAAAIEAADGDLEQVAALQASPAGQESLLARMRTVAEQGIAGALAEARFQGVEMVEPAVDDLIPGLEARANAAAHLLARALSDAATRRAVSVTGGVLTAAEVATDVRGYIDALTDTYLRDQFTGLLTQASGTGRRAVMAVAVDQITGVYASELLDTATCGPCLERDGHRYDTLGDAEQDYPMGGFRDCAGGPRCRGTLVAIYGESAPSVQ